jgi:predicted NUDIX family NTP pyrophosphohydrolase
MSKKSAGLLLYRNSGKFTEVLLVHPGGPFWMKKDDGAWSIPKGEIAEGEATLEAAKREFREETGFSVEGEFQELDPIRQTGGKTVYAWAIQFDLDVTALHSNSFSLEWPPKSGKIQTFPEVDRAAWFDLDQARRKILKGQMGLLDQFAETHGNKAENTPH